MHLPPLIYDLAIILGVGGLMSLLFQRIKQPVVLGYLLAGVLVGPHTPGKFVSDLPNIKTWAELGVIFLMFTLGLEFSFRKLARVGGSASITAISEVVFMFAGGLIFAKVFGWTKMDGVFLGAMLSVSSTTIIIKALDELKLKSYRFAELIFAALIVEDLIAILLLVALTTFGLTQEFSGMSMLSATLKLALVVGSWMIAGYFVVPRLMRAAEKFGNDEMITLLSLGLCLGLVAFASQFQYSAALGAFIMGSILAETRSLHRIERLMAPLKDVFGAVFFVSIGMMLDPSLIWEHRVAVFSLCLVTIFGKIFSTSLGALLSGQNFKNSVRVGFGLAQIGEFSFIIAALGSSLDVTSEFLYPVGVAVSLVTTFTTPYLIKLSGPLSDWLERKMPPRVSAMILQYARWSEARRMQSEGLRPLFLPFMKWALNGLVTSVIFILSGEFLRPWLINKLEVGPLTGAFIAWACAGALSAPFIWAMFAAFARRLAHSAIHHRMLAIVLSRLGAVLLVGGLSVEFFPGRYVLLSMTLALVGLLLLSYRRLEIFYRWYERSFMSTFSQENEYKTEAEKLNHLAPWDAHLVSIRVHPNSQQVVRRLSEAQLRTKYGVNIVAMRRGEITIVAPRPEERLLPGDELIVLGTDEQVEGIRESLELPSAPHASDAGSEYQLRQIVVRPGTSFANGSIRQSGLRENYRCMVVGIERKEGRIINPDSDLVIHPGDILLTVGERKQLEQLFADLT